MRIAVIVTDFPKITETFILRDLVSFGLQGHEVRVYHVTRFRRNEVVHDFAKPTLEWAHYEPYLFGMTTAMALIKNAVMSPFSLLKIMRDIVRAYKREPSWLLKSLAILPKSLAISADIKKWGADHVHAEFATHPATVAWINHRLVMTPYSVSCHAHDIFLTQSLLREKLGEASFVRSVSEFNKKFLQQSVEGLADKPIEVIHVSVDTPNIIPFSKSEGSCFTVLYVGSLEQRKGVNFLLDALSQFNDAVDDWQCIIIGGGPERDALQAKAKRNGLNDKLVFKGPRSFEEIAATLQQCHVMVVPSIVSKCGRTEGLPTVIIEALAYQRPVIASRVTGVPELVIDNETGLLVEPNDSEGIYQALLKIYHDPDSAHEMAKNGRKQIEKEFDLQKNVAAQLKLFDQYSVTTQGKK